MAGSVITAVAQWVAAKTIAATDSPNDTNWLEILQTHADRQEYLYSGNSDPRPLTCWSDVAALSAGYSANASAFDESTKRWISVGATSGAIDCEIMTSHLQVTTWASPPAPTLNSLSAIATDGSGTIVAGGNPTASTTAKFISSTDGGINWTVRNAAVADTYQVGGIAWFNSLFVAVLGFGNGIQSSPDGTTWTSRTSPGTSGGFLFGRHATDGTTLTFLAADGTLIYTTNGTTFSLGSALSGVNWFGVAYSPDHGWRAMSNSAVEESADGVTWTGAGSSTLPSAVAGEGLIDLVAVGDDLFVAVCGYSIWVSKDGCQTWHWCSGYYASGSFYGAASVGEGRVYAYTTLGSNSHCVSGRATPMP